MVNIVLLSCVMFNASIHLLVYKIVFNKGVTLFNNNYAATNIIGINEEYRIFPRLLFVLITTDEVKFKIVYMYLYIITNNVYIYLIIYTIVPFFIYHVHYRCVKYLNEYFKCDPVTRNQNKRVSCSIQTTEYMQ